MSVGDAGTGVLKEMRPHIQALIDRGNVTLDEYNSTIANNSEWKALTSALTDEAFIAIFDAWVRECNTYRVGTMLPIYGPEIVRRFKEKMK